jgi:hypothetical protein
VALKTPKPLFRRDKPTADHESVPIPPSVDVPAFQPERHIVHVPVARFIELDCDHCLRALERVYGVRVDRSKGSSAIDIARNIRATDALVDGYESVLFIDSDMMFDPASAVRLFQSPEPVIAGVYSAKKLGNGQVNCNFAEELKQVKMGPWAEGTLYPIQAVGAGFLRIKISALKHIAKTLKLPYCNMAERRAYPFFQPMIADVDGVPCYFGEDYSFIRRCIEAGLRPVVDTTFRLWHIGDYAYGIEEAAGQYIERSRNLIYEIGRPGCSVTDPAAIAPPCLD